MIFMEEIATVKTILCIYCTDRKNAKGKQAYGYEVFGKNSIKHFLPFPCISSVAIMNTSLTETKKEKNRMEKKNESVTEWVLKAVKEKYRDDIALVVSHSTLLLDPDEERPSMSYFIPITDRGRRFARTFIYDGVGMDIWGIEWERMEQFAELNEYNITCLADAGILYARTPEDRERFEALRRRQAENLSNPVIMRANALQALEQAKQIYLNMLFAGGSDVKLGAGYVLDYTARALAFSNCRYFKKAQAEQLEELSQMERVPEQFARRYLEVIQEKDEANQKKQCFELICLVQTFLERPSTRIPKEKNFQDLADWYCELSYTWLRIRCYCKAGDSTKAYMWGIMLQEELNRVCEDFGLPKMELMRDFDASRLQPFSENANRLEQEMRRIITEGGGRIREYHSYEEFINEI